MADLDTESSKEYEAKIKVLEEKCKDAEKSASKTLVQHSLEMASKVALGKDTFRYGRNTHIDFHYLCKYHSH